MKRGKKYLAALEKIEAGKKHTLEEAVAKLKEVAFAKFDETVELTMWLGAIDPSPQRRANFFALARVRRIAGSSGGAPQVSTCLSFAAICPPIGATGRR